MIKASQNKRAGGDRRLAAVTVTADAEFSFFLK